MFGNIVSTIKSRLSTRVVDESFQPHVHSSDVSKSRNTFIKLLRSSYAIVSQNQDDAFCNENLFMLPRVISQNTENVGLWSPVSFKPPEKSLNELDNVAEKFIRCISLENCRDDTNVNTKILHLYIKFNNNLINGLYPIPVSF